jgi:hypothetical protein
VTLTASVPAGKHTIRLENRGADWATIGRITLSPFGPALRAMGKIGPGLRRFVAPPRRQRHAAAGQNSVTGTVTLPGLAPGNYRLVWWDTRAGPATVRRLGDRFRRTIPVPDHAGRFR